ncbi:MAG: sulfatase-like hydrolase/transferase [Candidatus Cloacimonetes bacterium]|nr:sulfatase-like hydrolase/transferase [Candidatus Cloacimonadota bacterium]
MKYWQNIKESSLITFKILLFNFLATLIISSFYITTTNEIRFVSSIYLTIALISNSLMIYLVLGILFFLISALSPFKKVIKVFSILFFSLLHFINLADVFQFSLFKYHVNGMVINQFTAFLQGESDSVTLGFGTILAGILLILLVLGYQWIVMILISKTKNFNVKKVTKYAVICTCLFIMADKSWYAVADLSDNVLIMGYRDLFPFYQPMTIKRTARKFGYKDNRENFKISRSNSRLNYPLKELEFEEILEYPNILWIILDAARFDMFNEEIMPNIYKMSKEAKVFKNHYSGGNASRFGVFSMFYGVYGTYWQQFLSERISPVFLNHLQQINYDFRILSSTKLSSPEFRKTCFVNLSDYIHDEFQGESSLEKDPLLKNDFIQWINTRDNEKPFFSFIFFDAPHGPYSYPEKFDKYKPSRRSINYATITKKDTLILKNSYKNAIYWNDSLFGEIVETLKATGLYEKTIILVTGDHGEEFFERGFYGHTNAFSDMQTKVPLIIRIPHQTHQEFNHFTSHHDLPVTFMEQLGCVSEPTNYSNGKNLFDTKPIRSVFTSGWDDAAIITDEATFVFGTSSYKTNFFIRDSKYSLITDKKLRNRLSNKYLPEINQTRKEMSRFLK